VTTTLGSDGEKSDVEPGVVSCELELAAVSDTGPARRQNEDRWGHLRGGPSSLVVVVADGVSSYAGGDTASQMAVDVTLRAWSEQEPTVKDGKRLTRAAQQANIEIHDLAYVVPELRGMATTLTAVAIVDGTLVASHVGDSRLYLVRGGRATQLTKDHRSSPHVLTRCVGRELIAAIDQLSRPLEQGDTLVLCTDGLHGVVPDAELARLVTDAAPADACRALVDAALARQSQDNVTAAVIRVVGPTPERARAPGVVGRLRRLVGRSVGRSG
jgi:serine/threonine protein phosphatase PrpC